MSHVFCTSDASVVIKSYSPELIVHPLLLVLKNINVIRDTLHLKAMPKKFHLKGQVHGSVHTHLSKCCFSAGTCCIVYANNMIVS